MRVISLELSRKIIHQRTTNPTKEHMIRRLAHYGATGNDLQFLFGLGDQDENKIHEMNTCDIRETQEIAKHLSGCDTDNYDFCELDVVKMLRYTYDLAEEEILELIESKMFKSTLSTLV